LTRKDYQTLALKRLADAEALFRAKRFDASYYIAGYAIECAFKACIAKRMKRYDFPDRDSNKVYTHNLKVLLAESGISGHFRQELANDPELHVKWEVTKDWSERSRYEELGKKLGRQRSEALLTAISDRNHGILQCLRKYW
jgi:hypothetical protein